MNDVKKSDDVKIVRADAIGGDALDIAFSNGNIVLLQTELILSLPGFEKLREDDRILYPKTDGNTIYWRDGPRPIGIDEFLALIGKTENKEEK